MPHSMTTIQTGRPPRVTWTGEEFDRMSRSGLLDGRRVELINGDLLEKHVELIDGDILEQAPMNDPHAQAIQLGTYALLQAFPPTHFTLRVQCPMRLGESRPFPDFVVVSGTPREVVNHPTSALLVIEVSDTTLDFDRGEKALLYAANGITDYWIVNLNEKCVEVYRESTRAAGDERKYGEPRIYRASDVVNLLAAPQTSIAVADLLP
jgi:Uma2 family endonuclease